MPLPKDDIPVPIGKSWLNEQSTCSCDFVGDCTSSTGTTQFQQSGPLSGPLEKDLTLHVIRSRRRVTFDSREQVVEVPHLNDLSKECIDSTWYNKNDFKKQRRHIKSTILLLARGDNVQKGDDTNYCFRGLEAITKPGRQRQRQQQERASNAVFRAQAFQRSQGFIDQMYVAELYSEHSRTSSAKAYSRGLHDRLEASW